MVVHLERILELVSGRSDYKKQKKTIKSGLNKTKRLFSFKLPNLKT